jgi:hypothetical protein
MGLSKGALLALKGLGREARMRIAERLNITEDTLYRWSRTNSDQLTKAAVMEVIMQETHLPYEVMLDREVQGTVKHLS